MEPCNDNYACTLDSYKATVELDLNGFSNRCDSEFQHPKYHMFRRDRLEDKGGGGVMVFISKAYSIFSVDISKSIEAINFSIRFEKKNIAFIAAYRPPHLNNEKLFFESLTKKVNDLDKNNNEVIIIGDLNYNMLLKKDNPLVIFCKDHGFKNTNKTVGTRLNVNKNLLTPVWTLLDVILCYSLRKFINTTIFPFHSSDHAMVVTMFNFKKEYLKSNSFVARSLSPKNLDSIKLSLSRIIPTFSFESSDIPMHWSVLKDLILSVVNNIAPLKKYNTKSLSNVPWFDKELVQLGRIRDKNYHSALALSKYKNIPCEDIKVEFDKFKESRNQFHSAFKKKKSDYFKNVIDSQSTSSKKLWRNINCFINPNKKASIVPNLILKGESKNTNLDAANCFVNFFSTIINKYAFLQLNICIAFITTFFKNSFKFVIPAEAFTFAPISISEVFNLLNTLDIGSAKGEVGIETLIFKECADILSLPFANLFNQCIKYNFMPLEWKIAHLSPDYKGKGSKSDINNYRPLSVLSPIAKIYEQLLAARITNYLESNNLLHSAQFGFRKGLSCELALNTLIQKIRDKLDLKEYGIAIFLDLSKAFDTINHKLLLFKLKFYNFSPSAIALLDNYLKDRSMKVKLNGTFSKSEPLTVGVPQGSVLGPLLFIIFINDLCFLPIFSYLVLFADDSTMFLSGKKLFDLLEKVKTDLGQVCEWLKHNQLILNWDKTHAMFFPFSTHDQTNPLIKPTNILINVDNHNIEFVPETKILGVTLDYKLKFDQHVNNILKKVNAKTLLISRNSKMFSCNFRTTLFKLFIMPNFEYCSSLFTYSKNSYTINRLETCFCKSIKRILFIDIFDLSPFDQFKTLFEYNILPLVIRQFYHMCSFLFIVMSNKNLALYTIINSNKAKRKLRHQYVLPKFNSDIKKYSFEIISVKILNILSLENNNFVNNNQFKLFLKNSLINFYKLANNFFI